MARNPENGVDGTLRLIGGSLDNREAFLRRVPYVVVAVLGITLGFLPGGTIDYPNFWASLVVLAAFIAIEAIRWPGRPAWRHLASALAYIAFVSLLVQAQGGVILSGSFSMSLLAVLWVALYGRRSAAAVIVAASLVALVWLSELVDQPQAIVVRKAVVWFAITVAIVVAVHLLRARFVRVSNQQKVSATHTAALASALQALTKVRTQQAVLDTATRLAAELISGEPEGRRRASYFVIESETAHMVSQYDESGMTISAAHWPLSAHPLLERAVETLSPVVERIEPDDLGTDVRSALNAAEITQGAWVPVNHLGHLHGVLAVVGRGAPMNEQVVNLMVSLGDLMELALDNAIANEELERQARLDPLTGLANRRGLASATPRDNRFVVIAADLDGLKEINDTLGHDAGDAAIARFAEHLRAAVRPEDVVGRVGGDEFVVLLCGATPEVGRAVAQRILLSLRGSDGPTLLRASIGLAASTPGVAYEHVAAQADRAMYRAKRAGGMQWVEWTAEVERWADRHAAALADSQR